MNGRIENIVIVGGGTSGWMSAVFLNRLLQSPSLPPCNVTLIESSDIGTIGVGEATIPTLKNTFGLCGIGEREWMTECNASFKLAIKFVDWHRGDDAYWHPFGEPPPAGLVPLSQYWLRRRLHGDYEPYAYKCFPGPALCDAMKSPKLGNEPPYAGRAQYAYHVDAGLLADYLKRLGKSRGVRHVVDNVVDVALDERGFVSHLRTERHGDLRGELFVDCSGFAGLLINKALGEPFVSYSDALLCDSAVAIPTPVPDRRQRMNPYTTSTALSSGWAWHIPLFSRDGNGYVYAGGCLSRDEAERELRRQIGPGADGIEARHIKMRVGRTRNAWVKNCVAIGLTGGFIEPLESTAIWFVELGLYNLLLNFPDRSFHPSVSEKYSRIMQLYYEHVRDFIVLHYCTTQREDTDFWRANKYHQHLPETLKANLELWGEHLPGHEKLEPPKLFRDHNHICILEGMGRVPRKWSPLVGSGDGQESEAAFRKVREEAVRLKDSLPDHYEYLAALHGLSPYDFGAMRFAASAPEAAHAGTWIHL